MISILHISSAVTWRGGEQQIVYLLQNKNIENILLCVENSALHQYAIANKITHRTYKKNSFAFINIHSIAKKINPSIIHLHDATAHTYYYIASVLLQLKIPAVLHRRVVFKPSDSVFTNWKYNHANIKKIICISNAVKDVLLDFIDDPTKMEVIYSSVDVSKFNVEKLKHDVFTVGMIAALEPEKNIDEFIEIADKISEKRNDVKFICIGSGSLFRKLKSEKTTVDFIGFQKNIPEQLSAFDVFLFTGKSEGLGQVLLEAMAAKVPIICNHFSAAKELIINGKNGFIYNSKEEAINRIEQLLTSQDLRLTIEKNAFVTVQQFDISLMQQKTEAVYLSLNSHH